MYRKFREKNNFLYKLPKYLGIGLEWKILHSYGFKHLTHLLDNNSIVSKTAAAKSVLKVQVRVPHEVLSITIRYNTAIFSKKKK